MSYIAEITEMPIEKIIIDGKRYQSLNLDIVDQLKTSIEEVGLKNPLTVTRKGVLVSGLHRLTALAQLDYKTVPVLLTDEDPYKNDIEQIDENLVRQSLSFIEKAEQSVRKVSLMIKAQKNLDSTDSEEVRIYLDDIGTFQGIIDKLKIDNKEFEDYKKVILNVDRNVINHLKKIESESKVQILKGTYLTLSRLPESWQYRFINELGEKSPNSAATSLEIEYSDYATRQRVEEAKRQALEEAKRREEERLRQLEEERVRQEMLFKKQEAERKKREEEAERQRQLLLEQMRKAKAEEERQALFRKQEELERTEKQRRIQAEKQAQLERERLEKMRLQQEEQRRKAEEAEAKRAREEEEKKKLDEYLNKHNTLPPMIKNATTANVIEVMKQEQPKTKHRIVHYKETFTLGMQAEKADRREWIDSIHDLYRVRENIQKYEKVLFICYNKADILKVAEEIEKYNQPDSN